MNKDLELAQYILEKCTYNFPIFGGDICKIDQAEIFVEDAKDDIGVFEKEIGKLVYLLQDMGIVVDIEYLPAGAIKADKYGYVYCCEVSIPRLQDFIKQGGKDGTTFDQLNSFIYFNSKKVLIPKDSNQYLFCNEMYKHPINEWVSWDIVYEEMQGMKKGAENPTKKEKDWWKVVYDTMVEVNKKVKENLDIPNLFQYKKHEFLRTK